MIVKQHRSHVATLKHQLAGLSTRAALVTLAQRYKAGARVFCIRLPAHNHTATVLTVIKALDQLPPEVLTQRCDSVAGVNFMGGPPGYREWRWGTVLSMLCDAILTQEYTYGSR